MGKGSNVQKAQAARERNQKNVGKTPEERKASSDKAKKDASAFVCGLCKQTFMVNARPPVLYQHVASKHPPDTNPAACFPSLATFDPNDPKGEKKAAEDKKKAEDEEAKKRKKKGNADDNFSALLEAGLNTGKGKDKKKDP